MDMDLATPVSHIDDCLAKLADGYDVVIGSRQLKGSRRVGDPPGRRLAAIIFSMVVRALLLPGIRDTQCGFQGLSTLGSSRDLQSTTGLLSKRTGERATGDRVRCRAASASTKSRIQDRRDPH